MDLLGINKQYGGKKSGYLYAERISGKNYGYNEPIFTNEIQLDGINDNALRQYFKRMLKSGDLVRFDTGIYYLPKASQMLKKSYLDPMKVIIRKYIQNTTEIYGYFAGATFANQIGLTTQMPATLEIITSKESTRGRTVTVGSQTVRLKRPVITVTSENAGLLQFLDVVSQAEKYSELSELETRELLRNYAKRQNYSKELLSSVLPGITCSVAKKLIGWGIIYEFTSEP